MKYKNIFLYFNLCRFVVFIQNPPAFDTNNWCNWVDLVTIGTFFKV